MEDLHLQISNQLGADMWQSLSRLKPLGFQLNPAQAFVSGQLWKKTLLQKTQTLNKVFEPSIIDTLFSMVSSVTIVTIGIIVSTKTAQKV